eukprot:5819060-Amphidinium_carterae.1
MTSERLDIQGWKETTMIIGNMLHRGQCAIPLFGLPDSTLIRSHCTQAMIPTSSSLARKSSSKSVRTRYTSTSQSRLVIGDMEVLSGAKCEGQRTTQSSRKGFTTTR